MLTAVNYFAHGRQQMCLRPSADMFTAVSTQEYFKAISAYISFHGCNGYCARIFFSAFLIDFRFFHLPLHRNRDVAQLVAHYVRDVGVASSNLVIPTEGSKSATVCCLFRFPHFCIHKMPDCKGQKGQIANKASLHCKQALFVMQGSLVWNAKKPCLECKEALFVKR